MKMKKTIFTGIATIILFTGCASSNNLEQQVSTLSNKVDKLTIEVSKLKEQQEKSDRQLTQLKKASKQATQKLDNISASFKK